jgi:hypothetical protein
MATLPAHGAANGALSAGEEAALRALHCGWRFGIDASSERGLVGRRLVALGDWNLGALVFHDIPFLTDAGTRLAAQLVAEQELMAGLCRSRGGFGVFQGGLA